MTWKIIWHTVARRELDDCWATATDPSRVAGASDDLEAALGHDPDRFGESRVGNVRLAFHGPFQVLFSVDHGEAVVKILRVRWVGP
jgi:mRNA-degrading endonuclease RelE of RelBE toxin-antitoxin system